MGKVWCSPIFRCWLPTPRGGAHCSPLCPPHLTPPRFTRHPFAQHHTCSLLCTLFYLTGSPIERGTRPSICCLGFAVAGWCMANRFCPRGRGWLSLPTTSSCPHRIRLLLQNRVRAHRACVLLCVPSLAPSRQPEAQWVPAGRDHGFCPAPLAHVVRGHRPLVGSRLRVTRTSFGVYALKFISLAT